MTALSIPALTHADTYEYVNTSGNLETVIANSFEQALALPTDIAETSGVILLAYMGMTNTYPVTTTIVTPTVTYTPTTTYQPTTSSLPYSDVGTYTSATSTTGIYTTTLANSTVISRTLTLNQDGTATLMTICNNGQGSSVQNGTWSASTNAGSTNQIQLNLNGGNTNGVVNSGNTIMFDQNGTTLTASTYPSSTYPQGLVFTMQSGATTHT